MGMFSWFTSDEQERIIVDKTFDIYMTGKDGRIFHQRTPYKAMAYLVEKTSTSIWLNSTG
jgi:hypothetical protein